MAGGALGVGLQIVFALFIFRVPAGSRFFLLINDLVVKWWRRLRRRKVCVRPLMIPPGVSGSHGFILAFSGTTHYNLFFCSDLSALFPEYHADADQVFLAFLAD